MHKKHILLINLGTPDKPTVYAVYRYLTEFLNDSRVIDLPGFIRFLLVNGMIIPFRVLQSMKAYQAIWTQHGSPLMVHSEALQKALSTELGSAYEVHLAMRYGKPNINTILHALKSCEQLTILPLFPHYSSAATGSVIATVLHHLSRQWNLPTLIMKNEFYAEPGFIRAYLALIQTYLDTAEIDLLLFSYHSLPERHLTKSGCTAACDKLGACPPINEKNTHCYRAQCYATSQLLASGLALSADRYAVAFQSRLGNIPWIQPYTDHILPQLIKKNIKSIAVACPSFVTDCVETLEEINIRLRKQWLSLGGKNFIFIPSLNSHPIWIKSLAAMIKKEI